MKKRFIVIVLDGFGIGATSDAHIIRPQEVYWLIFQL